MTPAYQVGDLVKEKGHPDSKAGTVLSILMDERGYTYRLTAKEVDLKNTALIDGVKTCHEDELELVESINNTKEENE